METSAYDKLSAPFVGHPKRIAALRVSNHIVTAFMYVLYIATLIILIVNQSTRNLVLAVAVPASGFAIVTVFRRVLNVPRRYEVTGTPSLLGKTKPGKSFPSRHLYSAAVIAMTALWLWPTVGIIALVVTAVMAYIRVVGGVHYIRDVAVGAAGGIAWAALGYWLLPSLGLY